MATGYSGTPLPQKLGIREGHRVVVLGGPTGLALGPLPTGVRLGTRLADGCDVIVVFVTKRADLVARIAACRPKLTAAGGLWIAWPKRSSGVPTDIVEDTIRAVALPTGLVDNKVCAIDETWSGLRLVVRKELRAPTRKRSPAPRRTRRRASAR